MNTEKIDTYVLIIGGILIILFLLLGSAGSVLLGILIAPFVIPIIIACSCLGIASTMIIVELCFQKEPTDIEDTQERGGSKKERSERSESSLSVNV